MEPNEITLRRPYIAKNIEFARYGFNLNKIEEHEFPIAEEFTKNTVSAKYDLVSEVRLRNWRALDAVYQQFQEICLYYEFFDVDVDRYQTEQGYRQVMVSVKEIQPASQPARGKPNLRQPAV